MSCARGMILQSKVVHTTVLCGLTSGFNGANPASEAPLVERPVQGVVRRQLHSEVRATAATGVPEGNDNKLFSAHLVVDVVPDP
jgi:hypothetical protein